MPLYKFGLRGVYSMGSTTQHAMKTALNFVGIALLLAFVVAGCSRGKPLPTPLDQSPVSGQLRHFIGEKEAQAAAAAKAKGQELLPETKALFAAADKGDWL